MLKTKDLGLAKRILEIEIIKVLDRFVMSRANPMGTTIVLYFKLSQA